IISIIMCLVLVGCVFAGCTKQEDMKCDIVLITNGGAINDGGYNQSAWEGIASFADENSMKCRYYQPVLDNDEITPENVEKYVALSAENGAQYIILPGEEFAVSAYEIAPAYPDIKFVLLDAIPHSAGDMTNRFVNNVMSVSFDAVQSGFLAGYISVVNGNTELGYFGEYGSKDSANYGAGFVQGAAYAADSLGVPVTMDWAEYDTALLDYNYDFTITACYDKIENQTEKTFTVNVVGGLGSGTYTEGSNVTITANPAPEGKVFDKWEVKSDTSGVKDKKVNISSKTKESMNLLVEKCDCTITATYKDIEGTSYYVDVMTADGKEVARTYNVGENGECWITAPAAPADMVFDHWELSASVIVEDENAAATAVKEINENVKITPVYKISEVPTFNLTVVTGEGGNGESTGSGSYMKGDNITLVSAPPMEGYMFSHWENADAYGNSTGIAMENEYNYSTTFEMVDRYASICDAMYNHGVSAIFTGGNSKAEAAFTSKWDFDYDLSVIAAGQNDKNAYTTIVKNYGEAVKDCLNNYQGGSVTLASCATDGIYATFVSDNDDIKAQYDEIYKALADNKITLTQAQGGAGYDFCKMYNEQKPSKCLTLDGWFLEGVSLT
ncbi:MAG: BMP family ABC transporter substrate-binding protein, partial [Eubacterium sp.]|nr:BMP family ABC transporter substrate-binding protein [Eubacterium sp.]